MKCTFLNTMDVLWLRHVFDAPSSFLQESPKQVKLKKLLLQAE